MTKRQTTRDGKEQFKAMRTVLEENVTRAEIMHHKMTKRVGGDLEGAVLALTRHMNGHVAELALAIRSRELLSALKDGGVESAREYVDGLRHWRNRWLPESSTNPYHNLGALEEYRGVATLIESFDRYVRAEIPAEEGQVPSQTVIERRSSGSRGMSARVFPDARTAPFAAVVRDRILSFLLEENRAVSRQEIEHRLDLPRTVAIKQIEQLLIEGRITDAEGMLTVSEKEIASYIIFQSGRRPDLRVRGKRRRRHAR